MCASNTPKYGIFLKYPKYLESTIIFLSFKGKICRVEDLYGVILCERSFDKEDIICYK